MQTGTLKIVLRLLTVIPAIILAGCAQSIQVTEEFPVPVVEKIPLSVGIVMNEKLSTYIHVETLSLDKEWTIDLGQANVNMFRALFTGMFTEVLELQLNDDNSPLIPAGSQLDAIIEPRLEDFEFSTPRQSGNDQFSAWIKYNIRITTPEGEPISNWRVTAYGQEDQGAMGLGEDEAMQEAIVIALRDAAANIATNFSKAPGVKKALLDTNILMFRGE